jgi:serine/threonine protein phosphatase PrpC
MPTTIKPFQWQIISCSERGASHIRHELPNQDAFYSSKMLSDHDYPFEVLAVADGHGSLKSFRSQTGSKFAVEEAVRLCTEFLSEMKDADLSTVKNSAEQFIPRYIIDAWKKRVYEDIAKHPFSQPELGVLPKEKRDIAYGSTLLIAAVTDRFLMYFQIGDGEIIEVSDKDGQVIRPIPKDESLIANETTSLCMENPLPEFRFRFQNIAELPPKIILLSTDGYPNSFKSQEGFFKVGTDLLGILQKEGCEAVDQQLPEWLQEASNLGSGDDMTLGILYRLGSQINETRKPINKRKWYWFLSFPFYFLGRKSNPN